MHVCIHVDFQIPGSAPRLRPAPGSFWKNSGFPAQLNPFLPPRSCLSLQRDSSFSQVTIATRVRKAPTVASDRNHETLEGGSHRQIWERVEEKRPRRGAERRQGGKNKAQFGEQRTKAASHLLNVESKLVTNTPGTHTPWVGGEREVTGRLGGESASIIHPRPMRGRPS